VVVELEHLPGLPELGVALRVGGRLERRDADLVALDVVGMRVAAALVVRRQHVRPELADQPDQRRHRVLERHQGEAVLGQRRLRVALGPTGVDEAEPVLPDAEDVAGPLHLLAADLGDVLQDVGPVHLRVQDRAAFAAGTGGDVHVDSLGDVHRGAGGALARLVVGVGVDMHEPEPGAGGVLRHPVILGGSIWA
jgi:hypothetical protein